MFKNRLNMLELVSLDCKHNLRECAINMSRFVNYCTILRNLTLKMTISLKNMQN